MPEDVDAQDGGTSAPGMAVGGDDDSLVHPAYHCLRVFEPVNVLEEDAPQALADSPRKVESFPAAQANEDTTGALNDELAATKDEVLDDSANEVGGLPMEDLPMESPTETPLDPTRKYGDIEVPSSSSNAAIPVSDAPNIDANPAQTGTTRRRGARAMKEGGPQKAQADIDAVLVSEADVSGITFIGLQWVDAGDCKPGKGREIVNAKLAAALTTTTEFRRDEFVVFGENHIQGDDFILVGTRYFRPRMDRVVQRPEGSTESKTRPRRGSPDASEQGEDTSLPVLVVQKDDTLPPAPRSSPLPELPTTTSLSPPLQLPPTVQREPEDAKVDVPGQVSVEVRVPSRQAETGAEMEATDGAAVEKAAVEKAEALPRVSSPVWEQLVVEENVVEKPSEEGDREEAQLAAESNAFANAMRAKAAARKLRARKKVEKGENDSSPSHNAAPLAQVPPKPMQAEVLPTAPIEKKDRGKADSSVTKQPLAPPPASWGEAKETTAPCPCGHVPTPPSSSPRANLAASPRHPLRGGVGQVREAKRPHNTSMELLPHMHHTMEAGDGMVIGLNAGSYVEATGRLSSHARGSWLSLSRMGGTITGSAHILRQPVSRHTMMVANDSMPPGPRAATATSTQRAHLLEGMPRPRPSLRAATASSPSPHHELDKSVPLQPARGLSRLSGGAMNARGHLSSSERLLSDLAMAGLRPWCQSHGERNARTADLLAPLPQPPNQLHAAAAASLRALALSPRTSDRADWYMANISLVASMGQLQLMTLQGRGEPMPPPSARAAMRAAPSASARGLRTR